MFFLQKCSPFPQFLTYKSEIFTQKAQTRYPGNRIVPGYPLSKRVPGYPGSFAIPSYNAFYPPYLFFTLFGCIPKIKAQYFTFIPGKSTIFEIHPRNFTHFTSVIYVITCASLVNVCEVTVTLLNDDGGVVF